MTTTTLHTPAASDAVLGLIDVRQIPPPQRHALIFDRLAELAPGQSLQLVNDHDPVPLLNQLERLRPGAYECAYLQSGPTLWQLQLRRTAQADGAAPAPAAPSSCCGGCCGS